ncbi:ATP-grasp domain-containing protein [Gloeobacter kilaueensis]|uniref:D-alanine--D-lactate ligase n=1 Tax=Gloeobacter kilaueensis (strain ATCC BAA-2537 / CCAP 1431/1 / ULC 316 / JS1) TaxID=1183438 RepID=U5QLV8_GLOK1|nr:D-alanine--D-lactate ligase [Gloeobacter kilaueensis]AGY59843.1 D-alanine--D-lactate ligase [Gloeobacter kilaueensis JS1]
MTIHDFWVGSLHFSEAFGDDTVARLNALAPITACDGRQYKIRAEHMAIHEVPLSFQTKYGLIIDRYSYLYPQAIGVFMGYAFRGIYLINNPFGFYYYLNNKDAAYIVARELGISIPRTYILPPKEAPALNQNDFRYHRHFDWQGMTEELGWPLVIKPADGKEAIGFNIAHSMDELLYYYNQSGSKVMLLQQKVRTPFAWQIRCLCIGRRVIPIKYIFRKQDASEYLYDPQFLGPELGQRVIDTCKIINRLLGYEMNSVEFFIDEDGTLQAIDFNNPVPDGRLSALGTIFYEDYQKALVELVSEVVAHQRSMDFIPAEINTFAQIARRKDLTTEQKFQEALKLANRYYEPAEKLLQPSSV